MLEYDDKNGDAYYLRGCLNLQNGDSESALSDFNNAVKYKPDDFELYVGIYENLAAHNMISEGEEYLNQAFEIKGNSAEQLTWRGRIYYLLGQYENAQTELTAALEKDSARANLYLAQVYEAQGDSANAEKYYQAYVQTGTADSVAMNALAEIEMEKGNYTAALDYINQGLAMEEVTNQKDLMSNQIIACEYTGDFAKAWSVVQEYVTLYPEDEAAQREYIFLKNRQTQESTERCRNCRAVLKRRRNPLVPRNPQVPRNPLVPRNPQVPRNLTHRRNKSVWRKRGEGFMAEGFAIEETEERVILVGVSGTDDDGGEFSLRDFGEDSLDELAELVKTAGAAVVGRLLQKRELMHPGTYVGTGRSPKLRKWQNGSARPELSVMMSFPRRSLRISNRRSR